MQAAYEHTHFADSTIKAWRPSEFLGEQQLLDFNSAHPALSLLLKERNPGVSKNGGQERSP